MGKVVKLQSCDGEIFLIDDATVTMCSTVKNMLKGKSAFRNSLGGQFSIDGSYVILKKEGRVLASLIKNDDEEAVVSLPDVKASTLEKVISYCQFHHNNDSTEREKKSWDTEFVQVKQSVLCELASASYYLDIKPLVNLTSRAIATQISGKTSEEIRETFCNINYEVYAPVFASSLAARCRLQRKYHKKKNLPTPQASLPAPEQDTRSVDELLEFIGETPAEKKPRKKEKKSKRKERKDELPSQPENDEDDDADDLEDVDPQMRAALDQEVEDFRRRLESMHAKPSGPKIQLPLSASSFVSSVVGVH